MLNQKIFGEKLRNHRKHLGMTQEEVAEKIGVSPQAVSKWEAGECLPDCINLKEISDVYGVSIDVLLETEKNDDIDAVASKIEQIGTEFVWRNASAERYSKNLRMELGKDIWKMWKGLYFAEVGNKKIQIESKNEGNLRICGDYGLKIWDDDGVACIIQKSLVKGKKPFDSSIVDVIKELITDDAQRLIAILDSSTPTSKNDIIEKTGIELNRLNELLLLFTESKIIEFVKDNRMSNVVGYKMCGHCGVVAYMVMTAMFILNKNEYSVSEYLHLFSKQ